MLKVKITSFSYSEIPILNNISFNLKKGEHLAVLGESGCGKSTLLHLVYGLLHLENGNIYWNEKQLLGPKHSLIPGESFIKLVAQEFNIMPFATVSENVASHLTKMDEEKDVRRISELLEVVDMEDFANTLVKNLSGGQKQRVALAKALANEPALLLLDEPFSNIDTFRKNKIRRDLFAYLKKNEIACITATHDSEEALAYADNLIILKDGGIEASGSPEEIFNSVNTLYQAGFFGEVSILPASFFYSESSTEEIYLLPNQLKISQNKDASRVTVKKSYFRGGHYLIQSVWDGRDVFFENSEKLIDGSIVKLEKK
jgi:ABC-type sulfate/molybdate transport systems ATPase subunit